MNWQAGLTFIACVSGALSLIFFIVCGSCKESERELGMYCCRAGCITGIIFIITGFLAALLS